MISRYWGNLLAWSEKYNNLYFEVFNFWFPERNGTYKHNLLYSFDTDSSTVGIAGDYRHARDDNGSQFLTRDPRDPSVNWPVTRVTRNPWPATHDYSGVMTPDYCSFQSAPLSGSALKIKHHHCHKILRRNNWIKLTLWLKLCRKSLQCLKKNEIMGQRVTSTDPWPTWPSQICWPTWPVTRDPLTHCHLWGTQQMHKKS